MKPADGFRHWVPETIMAEYGTVTELPGINAHKEQLERLVQRYRRNLLKRHEGF